jgi:hypothetical protein
MFASNKYQVSYNKMPAFIAVQGVAGGVWRNSPPERFESTDLEREVILNKGGEVLPC